VSLQGKARRRVGLGLGVLAAAAILALVLTSLHLAQVRTTPSTQAPRARWDARDFTAYRIRLDAVARVERDCEWPANEWCHTITSDARTVCEVEVHTDQVLQWLQGSPDRGCSAVTVEQLFELIDRVPPQPVDCGPNGCVCDGPIVTEARFHPELGYPLLIGSRVAPEFRSHYPEFWLQPVRFCTMMGWGHPLPLRVESLTPLR
jgi:hypothetical protein